ncbi:glycoside hydrolase family 18 protein [Endogone sp. FLAS-F59071]|nr:glycoside hydrolase family 18 protein [Endogone sp. FLAS-F59071]|eukprot:RUS14317.1 glycoside hydrolase family 18 protein [Endogone sp. FLAS-F59071]
MAPSYLSLTIFLLFLFITTALASPRLVLYWGQNPGPSLGYPNEGHLASYCKGSTVDTIVISFVNGWRPKSGGKYEFAMNIADHISDGYTCKGSTLANGLPKCPGLEDDIKTCQRGGKKVQVALGGAIPASIGYGFSGDSDAKAFAKVIYNVFLGGKATPSLRPFGSAVLDGIDLDIETGDSTGYRAFTLALKKLSPKTTIAGAPQCLIPDHWLQDTMLHGHIDEVYMQFYNNPECAAYPGNNYNYNDWAHLIRTQFANRKAKLFVGMPASPGDAGSGYANLKQLQHIIDVTRKGNTDVFGGIALWEASTAFLNKQSGGVDMAQGVKNYLKKVSNGPSSSGGSPSKSGSCTKIYVSKAGDKCYKIAHQKHIPARNLVKWNPHINCNKALPAGVDVCLR